MRTYKDVHSFIVCIRGVTHLMGFEHCNIVLTFDILLNAILTKLS